MKNGETHILKMRVEIRIIDFISFGLKEKKYSHKIYIYIYIYIMFSLLYSFH